MGTLTLLDSPTFYNFSRNPITAKIHTDNYSTVTNVGKKAWGTFTALFLGVLNNTMTLVFNSGSVVLTFKASTNLGLNQVAYKAVGQDVEDYTAQLAADLAAHPSIGPHYVITTAYTDIYLKAVLAGPTWNLTGSSTTVSGAFYYDTLQGTNNITTAIKENYKIAMMVYAQTAANFNFYTKVLEIEKEPNADVIRADLGPFIDSLLTYQMPANFNTPIAFLADQTCKKFYIKIEERFGTPPVTQAVSIAPSGLMANASDTITFDVLKAGFDVVSSRVYGGLQFNYFFVHKSFLTRQPRIKKIARYQPEFLYFLFTANLAGNAAILYTLYDNLGLATQYVIHATDPIFYGNVWAFPINNTTGFLYNFPNIVKMEVEVMDLTTAGVISEKFTYIPDDSVYVDEKFIFFMNADGGMDTIRTKGTIEDEMEFESETANRTIIPYEPHYEGDSKKLYSIKTNNTKVFSGFVDQAEMDYIEDLFLSKKVFIVGNDYHHEAIIPIIITTKKLVRHRTNTNLKGYIIEYYEAVRSELPEHTHFPIV